MSGLRVPLESILACFEGVVPSPFATCAADGTPNVTYISIVSRVDAEHVALSHQFFSKSRKNLGENPRAQVIVVHPATLRQYRLDLAFERTETEGPLFEALRTQLGAVASQMGLEKVFVLRGADVHRVLRCEPIGEAPPPADAEPPIDPLAALDIFGRRVAAATDLDAFFVAVLQGLEEAFGWPHSFLMLADEDGWRLFTIASRGYAPSGVGSEVMVGQGYLGTAAEKRTPLRSANLARDVALSRAVRAAVEQQGAGDALPREIPLPGLPDVLSQIAMPLVVQDELVGLVCVQSGQAGRFRSADERMLEVAARHVAATLALLQAEAVRTPEGHARSPAAPPAETGRARVEHYDSDDSVFVDGEYLIKGVAGRILWKLLRAHAETGRTDFSNREIRLDAALQLPDFKDNLEARLILLRRRLEERCAFLRLVRTGRGRFQLQVGRRLTLENRP